MISVSPQNDCCMMAPLVSSNTILLFDPFSYVFAEKLTIAWYKIEDKVSFWFTSITWILFLSLFYTSRQFWQTESRDNNALRGWAYDISLFPSSCSLSSILIFKLFIQIRLMDGTCSIPTVEIQIKSDNFN